MTASSRYGTSVVLQREAVAAALAVVRGAARGDDADADVDADVHDVGADDCGAIRC